MNEMWTKTQGRLVRAPTAEIFTAVGPLFDDMAFFVCTRDGTKDDPLSAKALCELVQKFGGKVMAVAPSEPKKRRKTAAAASAVEPTSATRMSWAGNPAIRADRAKKVAQLEGLRVRYFNSTGSPGGFKFTITPEWVARCCEEQTLLPETLTARMLRSAGDDRIFPVM
ncbi:hypothetical protein AMAG_11514 [Allomyces macrogynus ATCC 38327]|uniref:BRCT domain-containing protein n=1 Tax=Allomyces macrogynus (strain ATCC 38327) TaxID=578462 RepID=A0A0L0SV72_ALLM3|nr:hypothetical protein AMAG_11514 [Allomyces macrogynus ATCC 38327]|eukprot:KNE66371.1 hypothetical protein AMAG_11514 [Allomyces macrogynus ATCC 38327]